jgi:hypothetical protein
MRTYMKLAAVAIVVFLGLSTSTRATQSIGVTAQPLRSQLPSGIVGFEAQPRFLLMIGHPSRVRESRGRPTLPSQEQRLQTPFIDEQNEAVDSGWDLFETINTFAPAVNGMPSQSGWHDHPIPVGFVQVIQGTLWTQEADTPDCLMRYPTGSVLIEHRGDVHNAFNFDPAGPTVLRSVFFIDRNEALTRTDQPDPITGNLTVASPPPSRLCEP